MLRARSSIIFDQLTNDFKVRKESIIQRIQEIGFIKLSLTELLGLNLFVSHDLADPFV